MSTPDPGPHANKRSDEPVAVAAVMAPPVERRNPFTRSLAGLGGLFVIGVMLVACLGSLPWTLGDAGPDPDASVPRYNAGEPSEGRRAPSWWPGSEQPEGGERYLLGSDVLGRSLGIRLLTGGGISLLIGLSAAVLTVTIGTLYGAIAGYAGGALDGVMMRIVDVLYGLPYILLVVLLAVAADGFVQNKLREGWEPSRSTLVWIDLVVLLVAISAVSWLTVARVVRGQVLSLKHQPFVEAARAMGAGRARIFAVHLLPNLVGPITVYATLAVPQAILQESFLSFLGIGVKPPLPSWGNLAADGLSELNTHKSYWWLLLFPCMALGVTLLALNFVGEGLREAFDPKSRSR